MDSGKKLYKKKAVPLLRKLAKELGFDSLKGFQRALDMDAQFLLCGNKTITRKMLLERLSFMAVVEQEKALEETEARIRREIGEKHAKLILAVPLGAEGSIFNKSADLFKNIYNKHPKSFLEARKE